jgi:hypothetical protein
MSEHFVSQQGRSWGRIAEGRAAHQGAQQLIINNITTGHLREVKGHKDVIKTHGSLETSGLPDVPDVCLSGGVASIWAHNAYV